MKKEEKHILIDKNNYKGYVELYKAQHNIYSKKLEFLANETLKITAVIGSAVIPLFLQLFVSISTTSFYLVLIALGSSAATVVYRDIKKFLAIKKKAINW